MNKHNGNITVVKKRHTLKNTVMSTLDKKDSLLGSKAGHVHDYTMLKQEFPPERAVQLLVVLGYQGILTDYEGEDIHLPHKKPRKSKKNPSYLSDPRAKG